MLQSLGLTVFCYYVQPDCQTQLTYFHRPRLHTVRWSQGLLIGQSIHTHIVMWLHVADMWFGRSAPLVEYPDIAHTNDTHCPPWDQDGTTGNWDCCPTRKNRPCMLLKHIWDIGIVFLPVLSIYGGVGWILIILILFFYFHLLDLFIVSFRKFWYPYPVCFCTFTTNSPENIRSKTVFHIHTMASEIPSHYFDIIYNGHDLKIHTPGGICISSAMCAAACVEIYMIIPNNCSWCHSTVLGTKLPGWFSQSYVNNCKKRVLLFITFNVSVVYQGVRRCEKTSDRWLSAVTGRR